jgi:hypothetical protein
VKAEAAAVTDGKANGMSFDFDKVGVWHKSLLSLERTSVEKAAIRAGKALYVTALARTIATATGEFRREEVSTWIERHGNLLG